MKVFTLDDLFTTAESLELFDILEGEDPDDSSILDSFIEIYLDTQNKPLSVYTEIPIGWLTKLMDNQETCEDIIYLSPDLIELIEFIINKA